MAYTVQWQRSKADEAAWAAELSRTIAPGAAMVVARHCAATSGCAAAPPCTGPVVASADDPNLGDCGRNDGLTYG